MNEYLSGLERMANEIARYFSAYPPEEAAAGIAEHLQKFWDPSMRRDLVDAVRSGRITVSGPVGEAITSLDG